MSPIGGSRHYPEIWSSPSRPNDPGVESVSESWCHRREFYLQIVCRVYILQPDPISIFKPHVRSEYKNRYYQTYTHYSSRIVSSTGSSHRSVLNGRRYVLSRGKLLSVPYCKATVGRTITRQGCGLSNRCGLVEITRRLRLWSRPRSGAVRSNRRASATVWRGRARRRPAAI